MTASLEEVNEWKRKGIEMGATHIVSVCDKFSWEDYPVYIMPDQSVDQEKHKYNGDNMQKINEIIELTSNSYETFY